MPHAEQPQAAEEGPNGSPAEALWVTEQENRVGDLIFKFRGEDRMRLPAANRLQRIVELLEEGVQNLFFMVYDLQVNGRSSFSNWAYKDSLTFFNELKGGKGAQGFC